MMTQQVILRVCVIAFGGDKTVTSGTFTIEFPAAAASTAIVV
jgi:hypothetical protein